MEKLLIVANFKSHMNNNEAKNWLETFLTYKNNLLKVENKEIIIAAPYTLLMGFNLSFASTNIKIASQDISMFDEGAYTGEVNGRQIKDFASYVIIGHSERRENFKETDDILSEKVKMALKQGIKPIYCVQGAETKVPEGVEIVAYEPQFAIGSGTPDTPENAEKVCAELVSRSSNFIVLYGGSVNSNNVASFTKNGKIMGVLVGGASLDPHEFYKIIENA